MISELYTAHYTELYRFARRRGASHEDAEDAVQAVFLSACKGYEDRGYARTWLYRVLMSRLIDLRRYRAKRPEGPPIEPAYEMEPVIVARIDVEARLHAARLSANQQRAVWLRHVRGLSIDQVAVEMGTTPGAVKSLCHRALVALSG